MNPSKVNTRVRVFRYRLHPTAKQSDALRLMLEDHCFLYNAALQERRDAYNHPSKTSMTYAKQCLQLKDVRANDPDQKRWSATSQNQTLRRLDKAFQAFFDRIEKGQIPGYPRFKSKHRFDTVTFLNGDGGKVNWDQPQPKVYIQSVGHIKIKLHREIRGTIKQFSITRLGKHWYLNVICEDVPQQIRPVTEKVVGIDRGVNHLMGDTDGKLHKNHRFLQKSEQKLAEAQQELSRTKKDTPGRKRAVDKVAKIHRHIKNQRSDHLHKKARQLVDQYDLIVLEALRIDNMTKRVKPKPDPDNPGKFLSNGQAAKSGLNKSILDASWGILHRIIQYKAEDAGVEIRTVNPKNTSITCFECKHVNKRNRKKEKFRCLRCGHVDHADLNAAKNILWLGLSHQALVETAA